MQCDWGVPRPQHPPCRGPSHHIAMVAPRPMGLPPILFFSLRVTLTMSVKILGVTAVKEGVLLASGGWKCGLLLSTLQHPDSPRGGSAETPGLAWEHHSTLCHRGSWGSFLCRQSL